MVIEGILRELECHWKGGGKGIEKFSVITRRVGGMSLNLVVIKTDKNKKKGLLHFKKWGKVVK